MRILAAGGGSGGHVTPVVAVIDEIAEQYPDAEVCFVTDRSFEEQARGLMSKAKLPVEIKIIHSGKFRRYAHLNFWQHLTVKGLASSNAKDVFKVGRGILQSIRLLRRFKPDVVFCKGGYVCLPIG